MKVDISNGELLDKLSILEIKLDKIKNDVKLYNVRKEADILRPLCESLLRDEKVKLLYDELLRINTELWEVEDVLREKERLQTFDQLFVEYARSVYFTNDKRARIKKEINLLTNSELIEEKSYESY